MELSHAASRERTVSIYSPLAAFLDMVVPLFLTVFTRIVIWVWFLTYICGREWETPRSRDSKEIAFRGSQRVTPVESPV